MGNSQPKASERPHADGASSSRDVRRHARSVSPTPKIPKIAKQFLRPQGGLYGEGNTALLDVLAQVILEGHLACCQPGAADDVGGAEECPICFLWYRVGLNRSACCRKGICTECFLQMNVSEVSGGLLGQLCPFCNHSPFSVSYEGALPASVLREQSLEQQRLSESAEQHQQASLHRQMELERERRVKHEAMLEERRRRNAQKVHGVAYLEYPPTAAAEGAGASDEAAAAVLVASTNPCMEEVLGCAEEWEEYLARQQYLTSEGAAATPCTPRDDCLADALDDLLSFADTLPPTGYTDDLMRKVRRQRERGTRSAF